LYVALGGALSDPLPVRGLVAVALYAGAAADGVFVVRRLMKTRPARSALAARA
jgi:hypothetical protein